MGLFSGLFKNKKNVLILEDDISVMSNHRMFFENNTELNEKFVFHFATDKDEYLRKIKYADAVLSDYYMGDLKFEDVWKECAYHKKSLILMTGDITKKFTGAQIYKPVKYTVLKNIIMDIMNPKYICPAYELKKSSIKKIA